MANRDTLSHTPEKRRSLTRPLLPTLYGPVANIKVKEDFRTYFQTSINDIRFSRNTEVSEKLAYARSLWKKVTQENRCLDSWDAIFPVLTDALTGNVKELPIALCIGTGGESKLTIIFDEILLTPVSSKIKVFAMVPLPESVTGDTNTDVGNNLEFMGEVEFSYTGGIREAKLSLIEDRVFLNDEKGDYMISFKAKKDNTTGTHLSFDCDGFQSVAADVDVEFSREIIVPIVEDNPSPDPSMMPRVKGNFQLEMGKDLWNDFIVAVSLPPFEHAKTKGMGFGFYLDQAYIDLSEKRNHPSFALPEGYSTDWLPEPNSPLWKGLFIKHAYLRLPEYQKKLNPVSNGTEEPRKIGVENLIIDDAGFSGTIYGEKLMQKSDVATKKFTIEKVVLSFLANELKQGTMEGEIIPPFSKDYRKATATNKTIAQSLRYAALVEPDIGVTLTASVPEGKFLPVSLFPGIDSLKLNAASLLEIRFSSKDFRMLANLNGSMKIGGDLFMTPEIKFEELILEANKESDYIPAFKGVKAFSFGDDESKLSGMPVSISRLKLGKNPDDDSMVGLEFDLHVNVMGEGSKNLFESKTSLVLWAKRDPVMKEWGPSGLELRDLEIKGEAGSVAKFEAKLTAFKAHAIFGNGYYGSGKLELFQQYKISATALWGSINNIRYGYFDILAENKAPIWQIPGTMGAMYIYGLGGGFYYKMKRAGFDYSSADGIGVSQSGTAYVPDAATSFGFKLMTVVGSPDKISYNGKLAFDVSFDAKTGGVRNIGFDGEMNFMTPKAITEENMISSVQGQLVAQVQGSGSYVDQAKANNDYGIKGKARIDWDLANKTLHGVITVEVNMEVIKGVGANNSAGQATIHFDPKDWYIYLGTPDNRMGLKAKLVMEQRITAYFMTGNRLPNFPAPPQKLTKILNVNEARDEVNYDQLTRGAGFMFGGSLGYSIDEVTFLIFYGACDAEVGMDVMLRYFGPNVSCGNKPIRGWIAKGQAYAYIDAVIGVKVDIAFVKGKFEIINAGIGALAQAEVFTTPIWLNAKVGGYFSVLGGVVKGKFSMEFEYGEKCQLQNVGDFDIASQMAVISDLTPSDLSEDVNVFSTPQAVFNFALEKPFNMMDAMEQERTYRIRLDNFTVQNLTGGNYITGSLKWNDDKTSVSLKPSDILPPQSQIKVNLAVVFEELVNGAWQAVIVNGQPAKEVRESTVTSGNAPDFIPLENVAFSYPVIGQMHFHPAEYSQGYIILDMGQDYLFEKDAAWKKQVLRFTDSDGKKLESDISYDPSRNKISFSLPSGMRTSMVYTSEIVNIPSDNQVNLNENIDKVTTNYKVGEETNINIENNIAKGELTNYREKSVFGSNPAKAFFRTSKFATFGEKVAQLQFSGYASVILYDNVRQLKNGFQTTESFDKFEIRDTDTQPALVQFTDQLTNNWFVQTIDPNIYKIFERSGSVIRWRNPEIAGRPPRRVYKIVQNLDYPVLTDQNKSVMGSYSIDSYLGVDYNTSYYSERDFVDLKNGIVNLGRYATYYNTLSYSFPVIYAGEYQCEVKYVLPGTNVVTSAHHLKITNF
ncbi:hypothetical protein [Chryseosolibacter indicus]|uniref:Uncharacterized protein n=1 Tax=Chryseosolibacter indicus TaxID=2782351 RepID=A0ABS5VT77_9BACT|nr:hypothetical protein [Chryseosolibacter indicus]MBT1704638.1 hypothetical protein [Chryseosolibacter indicus]